jgi:hypothetical protein
MESEKYQYPRLSRPKEELKAEYYAVVIGTGEFPFFDLSFASVCQS